MLSKHPVLIRDTKVLQNMQKLAVILVKGLWHVPYEEVLQHLRLFSLTHRRIREDLISIFRITYELLEFPVESTFTHPTRKKLRGRAYKFHQQRYCTRIR